MRIRDHILPFIGTCCLTGIIVWAAFESGHIDRRHDAEAVYPYPVLDLRWLTDDERHELIERRDLMRRSRGVLVVEGLTPDEIEQLELDIAFKVAAHREID